MKENAEKELNRLREPIKHIKPKNKKAEDLIMIAKAYYSDAEHFFKKAMYIESFEATIIAWAYLDAGLRIGILEIPEKYKEIFTIE